MTTRRFLRRARPLAAATLCLATAMAAAAHAQTQTAVPAGPLTLEQALDLARDGGESIGIARQGIRRAEREQIRARSGLFPQLSLSASYDRALASEFDEVFRSFREGGNGQDASGFEDLPFGRANTWRVSLGFSQNLFSGDRLGAQGALAAVGRETAGLALTTAEALLLFDVTQAYYDAALSDRLVDIAEATVEQASATLRQAEAAFHAGTQPEFEVLRARVSRDTQNPVLIRQRVNREVVLLRLKQMLGLPAGADLRLAAALADDVLPPPPVFASRVAAVEAGIGAADTIQVLLRSDAPLTDRIAVQGAAAEVRLREAALRAAEAERRPSVSLVSTYGRVSYPNGPLWGFDGLRTNWTVGATMQVPLLTGGRQREDERIAKTNLEEARLRLRQADELAALETRSAWAELLAARAAWQATAGTVQQASRAYKIADVRYRAGVSTQLELSDARLLLQQAEANRAQAARDVQIARARVALLPDLPLGVGGGGTGQPRVPVPAPPPSPPAGGQVRNASAQGGAQQFGGQP